MEQNTAFESNQSLSSTRLGLTGSQVEAFNVEGYVILENFLEAGHCRRLMNEIDELMARGGMIVTYPELGLLTSYPPVIEMLKPLMGRGFMMHHIHATRYDANSEGKAWHHDYRQVPQTNRSHLMVHVLFYLSGLNGEVGDLLLLPRSHTVIVETKTLMPIFDTHDLPGAITVDRLPAGSIVILHSALLHGRRPKPGGENRPRYFADVSYCQRGVLWPGHEYGGGYREINKTALELGLDRNGRYAHLYDSEQFFDTIEAKTRLDAARVGSLALRLPESGSGG